MKKFKLNDSVFLSNRTFAKEEVNDFGRGVIIGRGEVNYWELGKAVYEKDGGKFIIDDYRRYRVYFPNNSRTEDFSASELKRKRPHRNRSDKDE